MHLSTCPKNAIVPPRGTTITWYHPPHCLNHDDLLPPPDPRLGAQDFQLKQPEKTLAYAKALQHWAEVAKPLWLGKLHKLAECVKELRQYMEPLTRFKDEDVFTKDPPITLGDGNPLSVLQDGRRGSAGSHEGTKME